MKKMVLAITTIAILFSLNVVLAKDNPNGDPFKAIWDKIANLQEQIDNIQSTQGPQGEPGIAGKDGVDGEDGLSCWDVNGNNVEDTAEDANNDGEWNALDCKGAKGHQGFQGIQGEQGILGEKGEKGDMGERGQVGPSVVVVDRNHNLVGYLIDQIGGSKIKVFVPIYNQVFEIDYLTGKIIKEGEDRILYDQENCNGQAYLEPYQAIFYLTPLYTRANNGTFERVKKSDPIRDVVVKSYKDMPGGICVERLSTISYATIYEIEDIADFEGPLNVVAQ